MPKIKVNDISMYYEVHGQGEPLVFVSGFSADHLIWMSVVEKFSDQYQVILFDNRGAGQTDAPQGPYTIEQMASDIAELCKQLGISKAHFVGNSMGGYLVQMLAYRHTSLVKSLVISNSAMFTYTPFHIYVKAQLELIKANAPAEALIKASCSWAFSFQYLSQPGKLDELVHLGLNNPHPFTITGYEAQYAALNAFDSRSWAKNIQIPTLVIGSDQDLIFNPSLFEALAKEIPGSTYYCFKDCGHLPHLEHPDEYVILVKNFLQIN
jgi:pimeloyl-ACP methyl ester carboxylesterase